MKVMSNMKEDGHSKSETKRKQIIGKKSLDTYTAMPRRSKDGYAQRRREGRKCKPCDTSSRLHNQEKEHRRVELVGGRR